MKIILIQGCEDTGKTTLCNKLDEWLQKEIFKEKSIKRVELIKQCFNNNDFLAIYDIISGEKEENCKRILVNSASDNHVTIDTFRNFYENKDEKYYKKKDIDVLITTIRKENPELIEKVMEICNLENNYFNNCAKIEMLSYCSLNNHLLIQIEDTPFYLIKEKIKQLLS